jgi:hypothetical protein
MTCKTILNVRFTLCGPNLGKLQLKINIKTHERVERGVPVFCCFLFQCNKSCGEGGYQHRQVRCQSHTGEILADTSCSALERPDEKLECDLPQCHIDYSNSNLKPVAKEYQWRTSMWSQVSFPLYSLIPCFCSWSVYINGFGDENIPIFLDVFTVTEMAIFWNVALYSLVEVY